MSDVMDDGPEVVDGDCAEGFLDYVSDVLFEYFHCGIFMLLEECSQFLETL